MTTLLFILVIVLYMAYRFMKKRHIPPESGTEITEFEDDFKAVYGTTWDSWVSVKRDMLGDGEPLILCITSVFSDMYRTCQESNIKRRDKKK